MFSHLFVFHHHRTATQAIGFYIFYFLTTVVAAGIGTATLSVAIPIPGYARAVSIGAIIAILASGGLALGVLRAKNLLREPTCLLIALASAMLALIGGSLLGMIPAAYLTTLPSKHRHHH